MDARERKRYDLLVAISLEEEWTADEMCDCLAVPINYWLHPDGTWSKHPTTGHGDVDGQMFMDQMCVGWVIGCPRCPRIFAAGLKVPSASR